MAEEISGVNVEEIVNETEVVDVTQEAEQVNEEVEDEEFEVERILDVKLTEGEIRYLVRWKGYDTDDDTWEPESNLQTAEIILKRYQRKNRKKLDRIKRRLREANSSRKTKEHDRKEPVRKSTRINRWGENTDKKEMNLIDNYSSSSESNGDSVNYKRRKTRQSTNRKIVDIVKEDQSVTEVLAPRNERNAWLYEDGASQDNYLKSESSASYHDEKDAHEKRKTSENEEMIEKVDISIKNVSTSRSQRKLRREFKKSKEESKLAKETVSDDSVNGSPKVQSSAKSRRKPSDIHFLGLNKVDDEFRIFYCTEENDKIHHTTVEKAVEMNALGIVKFLLDRAVFGSV